MKKYHGTINITTFFIEAEDIQKASVILIEKAFEYFKGINKSDDSFSLEFYICEVESFEK